MAERSTEQVRIYETYPSRYQSIRLDKRNHFFMSQFRNARQLRPIFQSPRTITKVATRQFTYNHGMHEHVPCMQQINELHFGAAQVINPHGGIDQDHSLTSL